MCQREIADWICRHAMPRTLEESDVKLVECERGAIINAVGRIRCPDGACPLAGDLSIPRDDLHRGATRTVNPYVGEIEKRQIVAHYELRERGSVPRAVNGACGMKYLHKRNVRLLRGIENFSVLDMRIRTLVMIEATFRMWSPGAKKIPRSGVISVTKVHAVQLRTRAQDLRFECYGGQSVDIDRQSGRSPERFGKRCNNGGITALKKPRHRRDALFLHRQIRIFVTEPVHHFERMKLPPKMRHYTI